MPLNRVLFVEEALEELLEATAYLEDKVTGLGDKLHIALVEAIELILTFPEIGSELRQHQVRKLSLRGFSYNIIYKPEEDNLVIYALAHHKRQPNYWLNRLTGASTKW
jgi:plasmid stabilization system protein ParE